MKKRNYGDVSVTQEVYERLRARYPYVGAVMDDLIVSTLDNPELAARVVASIRARQKADRAGL
jgi:hypothetical protein